MAENERVQDNEELYRNVRADRKYKHYSCKAGKVEIKYNAFRDPCKKPSVDRAKLLEFEPSRALLNETNGIVSVKASDVRAIGTVKTETEDGDVAHTVDVVFCPTCDRLAHSQIIVTPEFFDSDIKQDDPFRFLQKALARLATDDVTENSWRLRPKE